MINAYQHAGIGVRDAGRSYDFYRRHLGFKVKANDHTAYLEEMESVIGAVVEMRIIMAANASGGGVIELCEHTSTKPLEPAEPVRWGDLGFFELGIAAYDLNSLYLDLKKAGVEFLTPVRTLEMSRGGIMRYAYLRDPDDLLLQLVEVGTARRPRAGGVHHVGVGVSDMKKMRDFYSDVLGFTRVVHEFRGTLPELDEVTGGGEMEMVILERPGPARGSIPNLDPGRVTLVHTLDYKGKPIFADRRWGDIGMMEMAFDVDRLEATVEELVSGGARPYMPVTRIDMGTGSVGRVAYVLDPEGNCIELVETEKVFWMRPAAVNRALGPLMRAGVRLGIL